MLFSWLKVDGIASHNRVVWLLELGKLPQLKYLSDLKLLCLQNDSQV